MPVEIRELIIRANIIKKKSKSDDDDDDATEDAGGGTDRAEIIRQCVKEVVKIMENNKYR